LKAEFSRVLFRLAESQRATISESTITAKGQTTVPRELREKLGAGPGNKLMWHVTPDGSLIVRAKTHSSSIWLAAQERPRANRCPLRT